VQRPARKAGLNALVQGAWVLALLALLALRTAVYGWSLAHLFAPEARPVAFIRLVLCNLMPPLPRSSPSRC